MPHINPGHYKLYDRKIQCYLREKILEQLETKKYAAMSQKAIAELVGLDPGWFRRVVTGKRKSASTTTLVWIACQIGAEFDLEEPHYEYVKGEK